MIGKIFRDKSKLIIIFLLALVVFLTYKNLFGVFYQQDEWVSLGGSLLYKSPLDFFQGVNFWQILLGKGRFLPVMIGYLFFKYFPFDTTPFAVFSLIFHFINAYLTYLIALKIIKNKTFSFVAAVIFIVNSVSSSAVSWYGTSLGTLPSVTLILMSLMAFLDYLETGKAKSVLLTFIYTYFSLFFKEIGIHLFVLYPIFAFLYRREKVVGFLKKYWLFILYFALSVFYRIYDVRFGPQNAINVFLTGGAYFWQTLVFRGIMYPLTSFSLVFIHPNPFLEFSRFITRIYYPYVSAQEFSLIAQTNVSDLLSTALSFLIIIVIFILMRFFTKEQNKKIIFLIIFTLSSYLPYLIVSKNFSYLESRYYYLAAVSSGIMLSYIFYLLMNIFSYLFVKVFIILFLLGFSSWHYYWVLNDLNAQVVVSNERKSFLRQLSDIKPHLKDGKNIFYITSDADYYAVGNKIPFQQGSGYTLMLWYSADKLIPEELFRKEFLYRLTTEGYMEIAGRGYGYYSNMDTLNKDIKNGLFSTKDVLYLRYDSKAKKLTPFKI